MIDRILQLVPAEAGWRAFYSVADDEDVESSPVVAWALVECGGGDDEVTGLVVLSDDPAQIVPASDGGSAVVADFVRYGFRASD